MRPSFGVLSLVLPILLTAFGTACPSRQPSGSTEAPAAAPRAAAAVPLPARTVADLAIDDTKGFLDSLRAQFRDPASGVPLPANAVEIVEHWSALPEQVRRHVPETTRLRIVWFAVGEQTRSALAVRVRRESNPAHPLGVEIPLFDGAPDGAKWVAGQPSGTSPVVALHGDLLLVADDTASLEAASRWLTTTAMAEDAGAGMRVRVPADSLETVLRATLDARVDGLAELAIAGARAEAAEHTEPPALGDPAQFVTAVRDRLRRWLAYLPDARGAVVRVTAGAGGATAEARIEVEPGSPLARTLAASPVGAPFGFTALPVSTALAISTRREAGEATWLDVVAPIAGDRIRSADRVALGEAAETMSTMRGEASVVALGGHPEGAFLLAAFEPGPIAMDPMLVKRVAGVPYVAGVLGTLVGCDTVTLGAMPGGRTPLCRRTAAPYPELFVQRGAGANAIIVAARNLGVTAPHPAASGIVTAPGRDAPDGLFRDPDAQRALGALGDRTLFALALSARGVLPSLGLTSSPELRRLGASRALPTASAPLLFALSRDVDDALSARLVATPHSLEELWAIAYLLSALGGG